MNKDVKISNKDITAAKKRIENGKSINKKKEKYLSLKDDLVKLADIKRRHKMVDKSKKR